MTESATETTFVEEWINGPGNIRFYTRLFPAVNQPRAIVLYVHGNLEHVGRYDAMFPIWAARDVAVFAFDQRGFGRTCFEGENPQASYGKTSGPDQLQDIEFFIKQLSPRFPNVPIFLMGFSMGGGRVLHFVTRTSEPPARNTVKLLAGVIAYAPVIMAMDPRPMWQRVISGIVGAVVPYATLDMSTAMQAEQMSHNAVTNRAWEEDPMILVQGRLRCINDMLGDGIEVATKGYQHWPEKLPVLFLHGDADPLTSPIASKKFHDDISAKDKAYISFPNALHEVHNEPDVRDEFHESCITWIERHLDSPKPSL